MAGSSDKTVKDVDTGSEREKQNSGLQPERPSEAVPELGGENRVESEKGRS